MKSKNDNKAKINDWLQNRMAVSSSASGGLEDYYDSNEPGVVKDMVNPNSQFRGAGRLLQLTGTAKIAKKFVDSTNSEKRVSEENLTNKSGSKDLDKTFSAWNLLSKYCEDKL